MLRRWKKPVVFFAAVCVLLLPVLPGCSKQSFGADDINFAFSCKIDVESDCGGMTCGFSRSGPQSANVRILSGGADGLDYDWNGDGFTVAYQGLCVKNDSCVLPGTSFASLLVGSLDRAQEEGALTKSHGGEFSGRAGGFDFVLVADVSTGRITQLTVPEKNMKVKFYDYQAKEEL